MYVYDACSLCRTQVHCVTHICMYVYMCVCIYIYLQTYFCRALDLKKNCTETLCNTCMYVCMYVYMCVCMCIYLQTYFCRALDLKKNCTETDIKSAYRVAARRLHPDVGGDMDEWQKVRTYVCVINRRFWLG